MGLLESSVQSLPLLHTSLQAFLHIFQYSLKDFLNSFTPHWSFLSPFSFFGVCLLYQKIEKFITDL